MNKLFILSLLTICIAIAHGEYKTLYHNQLHPIHTRFLLPVPECNLNGYFFNKRCYCLEGYTGEKCQNRGFQGYENTPDKCDDLTRRLDHLFNISPDYYDIDDNEFPRLTGNSIGDGQAAYGEKGSTWVKMHSIQNFTIFGNGISGKDIGQGALGNCYLLAAISSLANIRGGEPIQDAFYTKQDNDKRVYVMRWLIDGKPRFVATDDWVPGQNGQSSFSKVVHSGNFWPLILEKQWAKIHGNFMITEGGWQTTVWKALTQAPIGNIYHSAFTPLGLFQQLQYYFSQQWAVGAATVNNQKQDLVQGHAYAVLGVYVVKQDNGNIVRLIKVYNPWASDDQYVANPWADSSSLWTSSVKSQVDYANKNDGQFYLDHNDYHQQFGATNWAEVQRGYGTTFQQIGINNLPNQPQVFTSTFRFNGTGTFYVSIGAIDQRLLQGCNAPYRLTAFSVKSPSGKIIYAEQEGWESVFTAKVNGTLVEPGNYTASVTLIQNVLYHNYFTVSVYSQANAVTFYNRPDVYKEPQTRLCPKNCSGRGICNTYDGTCKCNFGWNVVSDCSVQQTPVCPSDCNGNGICQADNTCACNVGFTGASCTPCADVQETSSCQYWQGLGYCTSQQYGAYMSANCQKTCKVGGC